MTRDPLIVRPKNVLGNLVYDQEWIGQNAERVAESIKREVPRFLPVRGAGLTDEEVALLAGSGEY